MMSVRSGLVLKSSRIGSGGEGWHWRRRWWRRLLGWTIGHGYRPTRVLFWALAAILTFSALLWSEREEVRYVASSGTTGREEQPAPVPPFHFSTAMAYAVDTFIPVGDFKTTNDWRISGGWLEACTLHLHCFGMAINNHLHRRLHPGGAKLESLEV